MKRMIAGFLSVLMFFMCCIQPQVQVFAADEVINGQIGIPEVKEEELEFDSLDEQDLQEYIENAIYAELVETLDPENFYVEEVSTSYVSKEYLEEVKYNSQANIFFGYTLADLDSWFQDTRYVFTLDESGQTAVEELVEVEDDTYDRIIKNIAVGAGVILVSATVAMVTKNPAASATAGKTVKLIFSVSSAGAKAGKVIALRSAGIGGTIATIMEAIRTGDLEMTLDAGLLGASEGFKLGAIFGTVEGIANQIKIIGNSRFFPDNSPQALKYPDGVEFTKAADGNKYPRFEKWAKATAKFDTPTLEKALNHTGLSGNYWYDSKLANLKCGFPETPAGYVWHHVEDMKTMILVPQDVHSIAMGGMRHTGGASLIKKFLGI